MTTTYAALDDTRIEITVTEPITKVKVTSILALISCHSHC